MAETYQVHKTRIDAAMPTPALVWTVHTDNPAHTHDDQAVAQGHATFDGVEYDFEVHVKGDNAPQYWWHGRAVVGEHDLRTVYGRERDWPSLKQQIATSFRNACDVVRRRAAVEAHALDVLSDYGITVPLEEGVKLTGLTANAAAVGNIPFAPPFSVDLFAYSAASTLPGLTITAVLPTGASISWGHGTNAAVTTASASFTLATGENVITATVSKEGHEDTVYTLTITKQED